MLFNLSVLLLSFVPLQDELQKASEMHKKRGGIKTKNYLIRNVLLWLPSIRIVRMSKLQYDKKHK